MRSAVLAIVPIASSMNSGLLLVALRVGDDELELRDRVLQVMHHEGRQPVVGFELTALGQATVGVLLRDVGGDVPAQGLQQVAIFVG